jgi:hypothetical protein
MLRSEWTTTHRSGMMAGARRLQLYRIMQTQLETTRIHIAISERPMWTTSSESEGLRVLETTFLCDGLLSSSAGNGCNIYTYQSVKSIATYIIPIAKIKWNQEYYGDMRSEGPVYTVKENSHIVTSSGSFIIPRLSEVFLLFVLVFFI